MYERERWLKVKIYVLFYGDSHEQLHLFDKWIYVQ
jgi:hypothetical protein